MRIIIYVGRFSLADSFHSLMCIPVIFGFDDYDGKISDLEGHHYYCSRCHNVSMEAIKHRKFFSLFWIPVVPIHLNKRLKCSICGAYRDLPKEEVKRMIAEKV